jgi:hypothetical protein
MNSPTHVYTDEDVRFGKRLIGLLRSRPGEMSIEEAAALASREP